jgi:hypothetical protein
MAEAALDYDQLLDQPPLEIPAGGIANFITATTGSWADEDDIPRNGIAEVKKVANKLAEYGRHEDEYMVHAAEGETVIPMAVFRENPRLKEKLFEQMRMMGIDPERYVVGNELNSINPVTGQPEFFLKKLWRGVKKVFKKVIHVVLPVVLNTMFPGMGLIASSALSSGVITLTQGGSFGDALKSAAMGGAAAGLFKGIQGGIQGARSGQGFGAGFRSGFTSGLPASDARLRMQARQEGRAILNPEEIPVEEVNLPGAPDSKQIFKFPGDPEVPPGSNPFAQSQGGPDPSQAADFTGKPYLMGSQSDVVPTDTTADFTGKPYLMGSQSDVVSDGYSRFYRKTLSYGFPVRCRFDGRYRRPYSKTNCWRTTTSSYHWRCRFLGRKTSRKTSRFFCKYKRCLHPRWRRAVRSFKKCFLPERTKLGSFGRGSISGS